MMRTLIDVGFHGRVPWRASQRAADGSLYSSDSLRSAHPITRILRVARSTGRSFSAPELQFEHILWRTIPYEQPFVTTNIPHFIRCCGDHGVNGVSGVFSPGRKV